MGMNYSFQPSNFSFSYYNLNIAVQKFSSMPLQEKIILRWYSIPLFFQFKSKKLGSERGEMYGTK